MSRLPWKTPVLDPTPGMRVQWSGSPVTGSTALYSTVAFSTRAPVSALRTAPVILRDGASVKTTSSLNGATRCGNTPRLPRRLPLTIKVRRPACFVPAQNRPSASVQVNAPRHR